MRPSALIKEQRNKDLLKGFPVLILVILALSFLKATITDHTPVAVPAQGDVYVQIEGYIKYPGVYSFNHKPDLRELIKMGGGSKSETPPAIPFDSGSKVTVLEDNGSYAYSHGEISSFHKITLGLPVSINTESEEGLTAVPGIGPSLAGTIVTERTRRGGFKTLEELKSVYGIGDKKYKTIISYVTLY
jgi:competence protein ComEA